MEGKEKIPVRVRKALSPILRVGFPILLTTWVVSMAIMNLMPLKHNQDIYTHADYITKLVTTAIAIVSAIAFWYEFSSTTHLNESDFIMELNNQFITNSEMVQIEQALELYYNNYESLRREKFEKEHGPGSSKVDERYLEEELGIDVVKNIKLELDLSRDSEDCQKLINYLVYLKGIATLVEAGDIHIERVQDLMDYRFFVAVNNPVVQSFEILQYQDFYDCLFKLSKDWIERIEKKREKEKRKREESIDNNPNFKTVPMYQFRLDQSKEEDYLKEIPLLEATKAKSIDDKKDIAACIYDSNDYLYPEAFGDEREKAIKHISRLIGAQGTIFDYKNILVARYNDQVAGLCVLADGSETWNEEELLGRLGEGFRNSEGFRYASEKYFKILGKDKPKDVTEVAVFALGKGYEYSEMSHRIKDVLLDCLRNHAKNEAAKPILHLTLPEEDTPMIEYLEGHGFAKDTSADSTKGFVAAGLDAPNMASLRCDTRIAIEDAAD